MIHGYIRYADTYENNGLFKKSAVIERESEGGRDLEMER